MRTLIICLLLASVMLFGCFGETPPANDTNVTPPPTPPAAKTPSFTIASPADGSVVYVQGETGDVTLSLSTQNLVLKQPGGAANKGEGHFKVSVDGGTATTVTSKTYLLSGLTLGQHTVRVELLNNDRTSYAPAIIRESTFTVEPEQPPEYVPQTYTVNIEDFSYEPAAITVKVSDSINFVNTGAYPRSATCYIGGSEKFDTDVLGPGQSATVTFTEMMDCEYYSTTHFAMKGHVTVQGNQ